MIEKEILSDTDSVYNYKDGDTVLGYLEIRLVDGVIDIMNLFVNEENRKQGIATALMEEMFKNFERNHEASILYPAKHLCKRIQISSLQKTGVPAVAQ